LSVTSFYLGKQYEALYNKPSTPTNLTVIPTPIEKPCPKVICPEVCIYNDAEGEKIVVRKEKGFRCIGVKKYNTSTVTWINCTKEKKSER
jgi:hypothetical protein